MEYLILYNVFLVSEVIYTFHCIQMWILIIIPNALEIETVPTVFVI